LTGKEKYFYLTNPYKAFFKFNWKATLALVFNIYFGFNVSAGALKSARCFILLFLASPENGA